MAINITNVLIVLTLGFLVVSDAYYLPSKQANNNLLQEQEYGKMMKKAGNRYNKHYNNVLQEQEMCLKLGEECVNILDCCSQNCDFSDPHYLLGKCSPTKHWNFYYLGKGRPF